MHHPTARRAVAALSAVTLILAWVDPSFAADDKAYAIRFARPDKVGEKFHVSSEGAVIRQTVVIVNDERKEQPAAGEGIKLEGTVEVLGVTPKGKATKLAITIDRCVRVSGPEENELIPPGKVITAQADGNDTKFTLAEGQLPEDAPDLLELLFNLSDDDARGNDDQLFGTEKAQKVGATWPMNPRQAVKDFAAEKVKVEAADVSGTVKLEAVEQVEGVEYLKLSGRMTVKKLQPGPVASAGLPDGFEIEAGSMDFKFNVLLPTDPALQSSNESISVRHKMAYAGQVPGGQQVRTEVTMQRAAHMKRSPVK